MGEGIDLVEVRRYLSQLSNANLMYIGVALGLSYYRLVRMNNSHDDMIRAWLNQEDNIITKSGLPTWNSLCVALRKRGHNAIAAKISKEKIMTPTPTDPTSKVIEDEKINNADVVSPRFKEYDHKYKPVQPEKMSAGDTKKFCEEVKLMLHVVNEKEFNAATTYITAPNKPDKAEGNAVYAEGYIIGIFAGQKVALVQTRSGGYSGVDVEEALKKFPNVCYILGVGVSYAFSRKKHNFGDVLVSEKIADFRNYKFDGNVIINRGETRLINNKLSRIFCKQTELWKKFEVACNRKPNPCSTAYPGTFASMAALVSSKVEKKKINDAVPEVIGGEMEGYELLRIQNCEDNNVKGVIIIKGVVDYGDEDKSDDWQFTASMAAFDFTKEMLTDKVGLLESMINADPKKMNSDELARWLRDKGIHESDIQKFKEKGVNQLLFMRLEPNPPVDLDDITQATKDQIKELQEKLKTM